jgi:hypothetical protein
MELTNRDEACYNLHLKKRLFFMSNVLVMGGFTESKRMLEPVADEAVRQGFGDDADVITLRQAYGMDYERLRKRMAGRNVVSHSGAVITVPDASQRVHDSELPENFIIIAAPEPRGIVRLAKAAVKKSVNHMVGATKYPRSAHMRVVAGNTAELLAHPIANLVSIAPDIANFSTLDGMGEGRIAASERLGYFPMEDDEFYADSWVRSFGATRDLISNGAVVRCLPGGHDGLLIDPQSVLHDVDQAYARGHIGQPFGKPLT